MTTNLSANVVSAKIRALYGKRLKESDYDQLINKYSISEIAEYLKNETYYRPSLETINTNAIHRGQLELLVKIANFERYIRFFNYSVVAKTDIFKYVVFKSELEEVLTAIRLFNARTMDKYAIGLPIFLINHSNMDLKALANVKVFDDLLKVLKGTIYYKPMAAFRPKFESDKIDVVRCEMELRKAFYNKIFDILDSEHGNEEKKSILLMEIDMINMSTIYRLKRYFSKNKDYIKSCLLPFGYYLNQLVIKEMIDMDSIDNLIKIVNKTKYKNIISIEDFNNLEMIGYKTICKMVKKDIRFKTLPSQVMMCYVYLSDIEVKNIITIIEGVGYKISHDQIKKLLII